MHTNLHQEISHESEHVQQIDKRIVGERNRTSLLQNLHRFGWLTSRMISTLIWPDKSQALALSRRLLRAMLDDKLILRRELPGTGVDCYTLSAAGARKLSADTGVSAKSGVSLPLGNVVHRAASNWFVIHHIKQNNLVRTEHEIQTGKTPVKTVDGKVPDFLIEFPDEGGIIFGEVENAWKARQARARIKDFCVNHLPRAAQLSLLAPQQYLLRVIIVGTTSSAIDAMVRTLAEAHKAGELTDSQAGDIELILLPLDKSLNPGEVVSENFYWDRLAR